MIQKETLDLLASVFNALKNILLGGAGGIVAYMYDYVKHREAGDPVTWSYSAMFINMFIGAFVASSIATFIPEGVVGRDGIVAFLGVSSYTILGIIESKFARIILDKTMGIKDDNYMKRS